MRYAVPALMLAAIALAWLGTRAPRLIGAGLAAIAALAVVSGLLASYDIDFGIVAASTAGFAVAVSIGRRLAPRTAVVAAVAIVGVTTLHIRDHALDDNYAKWDPAYTWIEANAPRDAKIMLAGIWPLRAVAPGWPAFGPTLDNEVVYVGKFVDGMLRAEKDPAAFAQQLIDEDADALIVGRGQAGGGVSVPEEEWAGCRRLRARDGLGRAGTPRAPALTRAHPSSAIAGSGPMRADEQVRGRAGPARAPSGSSPRPGPKRGQRVHLRVDHPRNCTRQRAVELLLQ